MKYLRLFLASAFIFSCSNDNNDATITDDVIAVEDCLLDNTTDSVHTNPCDNTADQAGLIATYTESISNDIRTIVANGVPDHSFGSPIALIEANDKTWQMDATPQLANTITSLLGVVRIDYQFGIANNGVKLDPAANFPFENINTGEDNYEWVLEATNNLGVAPIVNPLDCNHSHLQADGSYHYHGDFTEYADVLGIDGSAMVQVGWAADGFPIYYKHAYSNSTDATSAILEMQSSYQLKSGERPGDGISAPCGTYNGKYEQDYEYVSGLGDLDECNGRTGITPEFPGGTYYYVITSDYPMIPRCFSGTPDISFRV